MFTAWPAGAKPPQYQARVPHVATASRVASASPLSLQEALGLAVGRSQQLAANNASITSSREMAAAAGELPDPVLKLGVENLPVDGPDRLSLSRDFMTMRRIGLSQELPSAQKRQLRSERFVARSRDELIPASSRAPAGCEIS